MKRLLSFAIFCLLINCSLLAQEEETVFGKSGLRLTGAWGGPSTSITKFGDEYAYFTGGFGGLEFNRSVFIGWRGYRLEDGNDLKSPYKDLEMNFKGPMIGFALKPSKVVHPKFMVMAGTGKTGFEGESKDKIFVLQPSAGIEVNIFRWFHLELDGGYRFISDVDATGLSDSDLSNFYGEIKFKFGWSWGGW